MIRWNRELDVSKEWNSDKELPEQLVEVAEAVNKWLETQDDDTKIELGETVYNLVDAASVEDVELFNGHWDELYDYADDNSIWVRTCI
jgi:hypothetical protein